ncbi:MAG: AmmeMemoRadiSam system protein B [Acidobacteria bacterium]|nr:AmmeMemoRadiSam system protein B [Acidobacteriota bacterium]
MNQIVREAAVAGRFYPAEPERLRADLDACLPYQAERRRVIACLVPHAGYMYSGAVAGAVFSQIDIPPSALVLGPNHSGRGHPLAIMTEGEWRTPLGGAVIDSPLAQELLNRFPALAEDSAAHRFEHSIEVELPFLQARRRDLKFVPIVMGTGRMIILEQLGRAIAEVVENRRGEVLIVASSDLNHYEDDPTTRIKDHKAIEKILALDGRGLYQTVINESISMCGFAPAITMLTAVSILGAHKTELVRYATSAEASGDYSTVVGYAGIMIE